MTKTIFEQERIKQWDSFSLVADQLGFSVRATGGTFLTHEICCSYGDYLIVLELSNN